MINLISHNSDLIVGHITPKDIIEDTHRQSLQDSIETYDFSTFGDKRFSPYLGETNRVIIPAEDAGYREFIIDEVVKYHDEQGVIVEVFTIASFLGLKKAKVMKPQRFTSNSPAQLIGNALVGTEWTPGLIEASGYRTMENEQHTNPYAFLKRVATEFNVELRFRIETDGNKVTGRYVDLLDRIGEWRGREVEFGKDIIGLERTEATDNVYTALVGIGPEREDGTRLEITVEDNDALQRWGRPDSSSGELRHLWDHYEPESTDQNMTEARLRALVENELEKRVNEVVVYSIEFSDLEHVPGFESKKIRFGDSVRIKDTKFNPPLYVEARVFEQERSLVNPGRKKIKLGDFRELTEEEVRSIFESLREEIRRRIEKLVTVKISTTAGTVFKNGIGSTVLESKVFLHGAEIDLDGSKYIYDWIKTDKNGVRFDTFNKTGKQITVVASEIDEKATFTSEIILNGETAALDEVTITNVFDGDDGSPGPKGEPGEDGYTPIKGVDYFDGEDGQDGSSSYLWVRYSISPDGNPMSTDPHNKLYIGIATTEGPNPPESHSEYSWSLIRGQDGVEGETGEDGRTSYLHIKYSNDGGNTLTSNNGETVGDWIGTYVDFTEADSLNVNLYTWNKVKGEKGDQGVPGVEGPPGSDGQSLYTWVKYADNSSGGGMHDLPNGKTYIGFAYNKPTSVESNNASEYEWAKIEGPQGSVGSDGETYYTWLKYADSPTSGMTDSPTGKLYMGLSYNNVSPNESTDYNDYSWSLIKGDKGDKGDTGPRGATGSQGPRGAEGTSVDSITEYYLATASASGVTTSTSGWTTTLQTMTTTKKYLWNYERINFSDGTDQPTIPVIIGVYGDTGSTGATGRSITSITEHYLASASSSGVTRTTSGWSTSMQPTSTSKRYLWNYETITWSSGTSPTYVDPIVIGVHGATGAAGAKGDTGARGPQGIQGPTGPNGTSQYVHIRYSANSNGNPMTTTPQAASKYIGLTNTTSATAPTGYASYRWALMKGADGTDGARGIQGPKGDNGTTTYTWVKYADTSTGGGMSDSPSGKRFIGLAFNKTTATESTTPSQYSWSPLYDNVVVGGRNLVKGTSDSFTSASMVSWNHYHDGSVSVDTEVIPGEYYTASVYYKDVVGVDMTIRIFWTLANGTRAESVNGSYVRVGEEGYAYITLKAPATAVGAKHVLRRNAGTTEGTSSMKYKEVMLERSNVASNWTPAPEDVQADIDSAKSDAANAQTTANGKNTVFYQTSQPSTSGRRTGDVWFDTDDGHRMWRFNGSAWSATQFGVNAIANLSITNAKIANGTIASAKIATLDAGKITAGSFAGKTFTGGTFIGARFTSSNASNNNVIDIENGVIEAFDGARATFKLHGRGLEVFSRTTGAMTGAFRPVFKGTSPGIGVYGYGNFMTLGKQKSTDTDGRDVLDIQFEMNWDSTGYESTTLRGSSFSNVQGNLELYSAMTLGPSGTKIPSIAIRNFIEGTTHWRGVSVYLGDDRYSPANSNRTGFEVWQYRGTGGGATTRLLNIDTEAGGTTFMQANVDEVRATGAVSVSDRLRVTSTSRTGGLQVGATGNYYHTIASHGSSSYMTLFPQRFSGAKIFEIQSHNNGSSFRFEFTLNSSGEILSPPTFDSTTTNAANIRVGTSAGRFTRNTSLRAYKLNIETAKDPYKILNLEPRTWYDKGDSERYAEAMRKKQRGEEFDLDDIEYIKRIGGLVAEEVVDAGLDIYSEVDENGKLNGVAYDRIWTLLIPIVRDHEAKIKALEDKILELEGMRK